MRFLSPLSVFKRVIRTSTGGVPGTPTAVVLHRHRNLWILEWDAPRSDGGYPVLGYNVRYRLVLSSIDVKKTL